MIVRCEKFTEHAKGSLQGFADLVIEPPGIRLHDCTFNHGADGSEWVGLPSRKYESRKGETKFARLVDFATRTAYYDFEKSAKECIRQYRAASKPPVTETPARPEISDSDIPF